MRGGIAAFGYSFQFFDIHYHSHLRLTKLFKQICERFFCIFVTARNSFFIPLHGFGTIFFYAVSFFIASSQAKLRHTIQINIFGVFASRGIVGFLGYLFIQSHSFDIILFDTISFIITQTETVICRVISLHCGSFEPLDCFRTVFFYAVSALIKTAENVLTECVTLFGKFF